MCVFNTLFTLLSFSTPRKHHHHSRHPNRILDSAAVRDAVILVDVENVRGKSGFNMTHTSMLHGTSEWADRWDLKGRVSLVVDHGFAHGGYYLRDHGLAVVFSGPGMKADDVIARDVKQISRNVIVVTSDQELMARCRRASSDLHELQIMSPLVFLNGLNSTVPATGIAQSRSNSQNLHTNGDEPISATDTEVDDAEIRKLGASLLEVESILRNKKIFSNKKRRKLEKKAQKFRVNLALISSGRGQVTIDRVTAILTHGNNGLDDEQDGLLLSHWMNSHRRIMKKTREQTGDRVLLAEYFRNQLEQYLQDCNKGVEGVTSTKDDANETVAPAEDHVLYVNSRLVRSMM